MSRIKIALFATVLLVISGATSFAVVTLVGGSDSTAAADVPQQEGFWNAASVAEAEKLAEYRLASPHYLPDGFVPSTSIHVNTPPFPTLPKVVQQFWHSPDEPSLTLFLMQNPVLDGVGAGEPALINGVPGERELVPAYPPDRPHPLLSLFWRDGEFGYILTGSLGGSLTEDVLMKVAASVRIP